MFFNLVNEKSVTDAAFINWFLKELFSISKIFCWVKLSSSIGLNFWTLFWIMGLQVWTVLTKMFCRCVRIWRNYSPVKDNSLWNFHPRLRWGVVGLQSGEGEKKQSIHQSGGIRERSIMKFWILDFGLRCGVVGLQSGEKERSNPSIRPDPRKIHPSPCFVDFGLWIMYCWLWILDCENI